MAISTVAEELERLIRFVEEHEEFEAIQADSCQPDSDEALHHRRNEIRFCKIRSHLNRLLIEANRRTPIPFA